MIKPEELKVGDILLMTALKRTLEITVLSIDHKNQQFIADFGPVPFTSLPMLKRK